MPFGFKKEGATYQKAMKTIFEGVLQKMVECYVDDLMVKSKKRLYHLHDLHPIFEGLWKCQLKMNLLKSSLGIASRNFLGFVVQYRVIEINQAKVRAIQDMSGWLAMWAVILEQYDLILVSQKAVKGQALADFLVDHPVPNNWELNDDLSGEEVFFIDVLTPWEMFFDGATRHNGARAGLVLVSPEKHIFPYSFVMVKLCSNHVAGNSY